LTIEKIGGRFPAWKAIILEAKTFNSQDEGKTAGFSQEKKRYTTGLAKPLRTVAKEENHG